MKSLYILYDPMCGLCMNCKTWLEQQPAYLSLHFIPMDSPEVKARFPSLKIDDSKDELVVISDKGGVYKSGNAWIMCLFAMENYRELSLRLATPLLMPVAKRAFELVSRNRKNLSEMLRFENPMNLKSAIQEAFQPQRNIPPRL